MTSKFDQGKLEMVSSMGSFSTSYDFIFHLPDVKEDSISEHFEPIENKNN